MDEFCGSFTLKERDAVIEQYLPLVDNIAAKKFHLKRSGPLWENAIGEGRIALVRAANRYNGKGGLFSYVYKYIFGGIARSIATMICEVRPPIKQFVWGNSSPSTPTMISLSGEDRDTIEALIDSKNIPPSEILNWEEIKDILRQEIAKLTPKQRKTIDALYPLDDDIYPKSALDLSTYQNHSRQAISQIKDTAFAALRIGLEQYHLEDAS